MIVRRLLSLSLLIFIVVSSCDGNDPVLSGDLTQVKDATLFEYTTKNGDKHSAIAFLDGKSEAVKYFDITENQYIIAPNGFSLLMTPVGRATKIAASKNFLFALNAGENTVTVIRIAEKDDNKLFTKINKKPTDLKFPQSGATPDLGVDGNPTAFAAYENGNTGYLLVAYNNNIIKL